MFVTLRLTVIQHSGLIGAKAIKVEKHSINAVQLPFTIYEMVRKKCVN